MKPILSIAIALLLVGCATTPTQKQRIETAAKIAAFVGTREFLLEHPESRTGFETARDELLFLETQETLDWVTLLAVVQRLPVKELKSPQAQLIISAGIILLSDYGGSLPTDKISELKPLAKSIREGIELGLGP